jgi:DNA-binding winged helix-turn-helix (wHTH) protein
VESVWSREPLRVNGLHARLECSAPRFGRTARAARRIEWTRMTRFGIFELDDATGELRKGGSAVKLRLQSFKVLAALVARPGEVVSRDDLRVQLWGGETFVDFDQGLNSCIKEIRAVLGDSSDAPLYVETLPRRGYRFIAPTGRPPAARDEERGTPVERVGTARPAGPWRTRLVVAGAAAVALLGFTAALRLRPRPALDWQRVTFRRGTVTSARFAPGGAIALSAAWDGQAPGLSVVTPGSAEERPLGIPAVRVVGVSPRGEVAYISVRGGQRPVLARAPLTGGPGKDLLEDVFDADLAPGGEDFAVARQVPGRLNVEYPVGNVLAPVNAPSGLRVSPDGRLLALIEYFHDGESQGHVVVLDREGRRVAQSSPFASLQGLAWAPDAREVWFTASEAGTNHALRALRLNGGERVLRPAAGRLVLHDVAPDGRALLERSLVRGEATWHGPDGERELSWLDATEAAAVGADGAVVLNETGEAGGPGYGVYLRRPDGSAPVRIGEGRASDVTADGRFVATVPVREPYRIALLPVGPAEPRLVKLPGIAQYEWVRLLPGGRGLVFAGLEANHNLRVWVADSETATPRPITREGLASRPELVAPEGRKVLAGCPVLRLCTYPFDGGEPQPIPEPRDWVALAIERDGRALLVRQRGAVFPVQVDRLDLETGARTPWHRLAPRDPVGALTLRRLVLGPDGRTFAYDYVRSLSEIYLAPSLP